MTILAIAPAHNSPGRKDASGAFLPESRAAVALHGGAMVSLDNRLSDDARRRWAQDTLASFAGAGFEAVAFFCHGFRDGLQTGHRRAHVRELALAIQATGAQIAILYACDAGRDADRDRADDVLPGPGGEGGFASALAAEGLRVDAHTTAAHTTINPFVRRFDRSSTGDWIVEPRSAKWAAWARRLRSDRVFRLTFPLLSADEIRAAL